MILAILYAALAVATPLTPRAGWTFVPSAQDLLQNGGWSCVSNVNASPSSLSITATNNYVTVLTTPYLQVQGDFSVMATLSSTGNATYLSLVGAPGTGSSGLLRVDAGVTNGLVSIVTFIGSTATAKSATFPVPAGTSDPVNLELARIGSQIVVFIDGTQAGSIADPGIFAAGKAYIGFNVAPQSVLTVLGIAATEANGSTVTLFSPYQQVSKRTGSALRDVAEKTGFLVGAAVDPTLFSEAGYAETLGREYNLVVAENAMKFDATEPAAHQFNFCQADEIVTFARANGMRVRGHNFVWQQALPAWLTNGNYSSADAAAILQEHITTVMTHFHGQITEWDIVNESIAYGSPYGPQPSYWLNTLGPNYVDMAFQWAHAADPSVKLIYNDTGGEGLGAKSDAVYNLVKGMIARGVPLDGVGLQMHVDTKSAPTVAAINSNIARLAALGLEVHITEMDVRIPQPAAAADIAAQQQVYQNVVSACRAIANCTAILTWGVTDAHSWIPSAYPGFGAALLFDPQYQPKAAYTSFLSALQASANAAVPILNVDGVVNHGTAQTSVSPGTIVDVYGANLAPAANAPSGTPLPTTLSGTQILVNGKAAPLFYVSPLQAVIQLPYETAVGPALIQVLANNGASQATAVTVQPAAPVILTYGSNRAVAFNNGTTLNSATNCVAPGSALVVYLVGTGPLNSPVASGAPSPATAALETLTTTATLGTAAATVQFAGMTPGSVGLLQVNLVAPQVSGDLPLQITIGGYASNQASVCVAGK